METLPQFPAFDYDCDKANAGPRWEKWVNRLENFLEAMNITDGRRKRALLLHFAGERVADIYEVEKGNTTHTYTDTKTVLNNYFRSKKNVQMAIYDIRSYKQKEGQSLDDFVTELRKLAKNCDFTDVDKELLSQIIQQCSSNRLRRRALREPDKTLRDILEMGRTLELADIQAAAMERETVHHLKEKPKSADTTKKANMFVKKSRKCYFCAGEYPHQGVCPAKGKVCDYCKKPNHLKAACFRLKRKEEINIVEQETPAEQDSDDEYCYTVSEEQIVGVIKGKTPIVNVKMNNVKTDIKIDTGASVNIIDEGTLQKIGNPPLIRKPVPRLYAYGDEKSLTILGYCDVTVETTSLVQCHRFYVVKGNHGSLLGFKTSNDLDLVKIVHSIESDILSKYPGLFKGIGKLKDVSVKLHIDKSVPPVAIRHRRTPFHLRGKVQKEIEKLLDEDIIERVEGVPTPWVSPIVTPPKKEPGSIRICTDMQCPNKAIQHERHQMPTLDEIITDLNGAKVFSKLDLRSGYHQLELDTESRYITTFSTHLGLFRYKRLNFGISSAAEIFQETIHNTIQDIPGSKNISDDILIYGKSQEEHDIALDVTLKKLNDRGLTLNRDKCEFNKDEVEFFGLVFSKQGVSPDPKKIQVIQDMDAPRNTSEVKSLLGMFNYSSRFIPDYATLSEPLRRLTKQGCEWSWNTEQENAFQSLKDSIASSTGMAYFEPNKPTEIFVDASPVGLGAILSQQNKAVAFASRALTDVEARYSQTEREALAVTWACEHFDMYVNGAQHFDVITDHKPLERIWQKPRPPLRIERWGLRLQPYKFTIKYQPGAYNPADYMSRHPSTSGDCESIPHGKLAEDYVCFIAESSVPNAMTFMEVKDATLSDKTLIKVKEFIRTGRWFEIKHLQDSEINIDELKDFNNVRDDLHATVTGLFFEDHR